jgi:hypothetical protein
VLNGEVKVLASKIILKVLFGQNFASRFGQRERAEKRQNRVPTFMDQYLKALALPSAICHQKKLKEPHG